MSTRPWCILFAGSDRRAPGLGASRRAVLWLGAVFLLAACGKGGEAPPAMERAQTPIIVWPKPPLPPRIRFVQNVAKAADLGIRPSFLQRIGRFFTGEEEERFVRPTGVAATSRAIYVADPGARAMWILSVAAEQFRPIRKAGGRSLVSPVAVALGPEGSVFLADSSLAKVFVYAPEGEWKGMVEDPRFRRPVGLAYDPKRDRLYVADSGRHRIWIFTGAGRPLGAIGRRGPGRSEFNFPTHLAVDHEGTLYVTDALGFRVQFFSPEGSFRGMFGKHGDTSGDSAMPKGVAVDSQGHIYLVEALFDAVQIFDSQGRYLLTFGERGKEAGQFWLPGGIFIDPRDRIYVADAFNRRIQVFDYLTDEIDR